MRSGSGRSARNRPNSLPDRDIAESVVDSSEIINTLKGGGISSLGYADVEVDEPEQKGLLARLRGDTGSETDSTETT